MCQAVESLFKPGTKVSLKKSPPGRGAVGRKIRPVPKSHRVMWFKLIFELPDRHVCMAVFILGIMHKGLCFPTKHLENHLKQFFMRCSHHEIQGELNETFVIIFL